MLICHAGSTWATGWTLLFFDMHFAPLDLLESRAETCIAKHGTRNALPKARSNYKHISCRATATVLATFRERNEQMVWLWHLGTMPRGHEWRQALTGPNMIFGPKLCEDVLWDMLMAN